MYNGNTTNKNGQLHIGSISAKSLVETYGSPLYVYDINYVKDQIEMINSSFKSTYFKTRIAYASKAFLVTAFAKILQDLNMSIDCVSGGELYTAYKAGFNMSHVIFHGNNKSLSELQLALDLNVGLIIVDSMHELKVLSRMTKKKIDVLLRVNPGIEAHTHAYIVTAKLTSKFGESIYDDEVLSKIMQIVASNKYLNLKGFHCHIGSQIFDETPFYKAIEVMTTFMKKMTDTYHHQFSTLNLGGGFGVPYTSHDPVPQIGVLLAKLIDKATQMVKNLGLNLNELIIEPGRSLVANAGLTLYTVGYQKHTYGNKDYVFVDGGMSDNLRPALYQALYEADIATNMNAPKSELKTIAGKLCESGDVLIENTSIQASKSGDILAIYTTGAYGHSMSSNYNKMLKPAVVFVENNEANLVVKRETYDDLLALDV